MESKVDFSSPAPTGAIISQFYLALEKCFEMKEGESVYIEKDGDVSKVNLIDYEDGEQIELKEYSEKDDLTDSHLNFWNTLKNWTNPAFNSQKYRYLILATTQEIGAKSEFKNWNNLNSEAREQIIYNIYSKAKQRYQKALDKNPKANKSDSLELMETIFTLTQNLKNVIGKILIDSNRIRRDEVVKALKDKYLKSYPLDSKDLVFNSVMGYVIREEQYNNGWEISYSDFSIQLQDLATRMNNQSQIFPVHEDLKNIPDSEKEKILKYPFVRKIEEIEYSDVIPNSLNNYWFTINTIAREFETRKQKIETLKQFQNDLITTHSTLYNKSSRSCSQLDLINKSKDFYDDIITGQVPNYDIYNNTPLIFKNGMYHLLANEDENIVWKLNPKTNE